MLPVKRFVFPCINLLFSLIPLLSLEARSPGRSPDSPVISQIILNNDSIIYLPAGYNSPEKSQNEEFIFSFRENNISFTVESETAYEFRFQLSGFEKTPTKWQKRGFKEYTSLPAGNYTFHAWYRDNEGEEKEFGIIPFVIRPLWYFSKLALLLYMVSVLLFILVMYDASRFTICPQTVHSGTDY